MRAIDRVLVAGLTAALAGVALHSAAERPAWAAARVSDPPAIGVCAMPTLINELMASDRFRPALAGAAQDLQDELLDITEEMQEITDALEDTFDPENPEDQRRAQRFRELQMRSTSLQRQIAAARNRKQAEQLAECYKLVRTSADAIGAELDFDYVISTGDPDEELAPSPDVVLRQITARPVLRFPEGTDITDDVRDDLNLD